LGQRCLAQILSEFRPALSFILHSPLFRIEHEELLAGVPARSGEIALTLASNALGGVTIDGNLAISAIGGIAQASSPDASDTLSGKQSTHFADSSGFHWNQQDEDNSD
jgi:hypothetical protein